MIKSYKGGFNKVVTVYSVSKKGGRLTRVSLSESVTWVGDSPSMVVNVDDHDPMLVLIDHHGNSSWTQLVKTVSAAARLKRAGLVYDDEIVKKAIG